MKHLAQLLLATLVLCCGCAEADILSPSEFTQEFAESFRQARPGLKVTTVRDLELKLTTADGRDTTSYLNNAYDTYKQDPKAKAEVIQKYVTSGLEAIGALREELDSTRIIPIIKDRPWLEEMRKALLKRGVDKPPALVYEEFNPDLVIVYAVDSPKNIAYLTPAQLERGKIKRGELRGLACENLKRLLPKIEWRGTNGFYMITAGGNYEASLLLLDSMWAAAKTKVQGDFVVAVPTRDLLLVTGSGQPQGIETIKKIVRKASVEGSYRLTSKLFIYRNGKFDDYMEEGSPAAKRNGQQSPRPQ